MGDRDGILSEALVEALRPLVAELVREEIAALRDELCPEPRQEVYTVEEAAAYLRCSEDAVRMRAKRGRLDVRRQGRRVYITGESLQGLASDGR
jgi:excisionase family DNA binding protein